MTSFTNPEGTGSVIADTATITTLAATTITGAITGSVAGFTTIAGLVQTLAAAGATQGAATAITKSLAFITTCTASARGVKLPTAATGLMQWVVSLCTQGTKVYPFSGDKITSSATNTAVVIAGFKANLYVAKDATTWGLLKGA